MSEILISRTNPLRIPLDLRAGIQLIIIVIPLR